MIQFSPTLIVRRLVIQRGEHVVYDERFHVGVNILRGDNSSGKSTVLNFLFYSLGGDLSDWSDVALKCTRVLVEVALNGMIATFAREISNSSRRPMDIFSGSYEDAIKAPIGEWSRYPYSRSENVESFSQALFRLLNLPEVVNDATGNLTFHQVLRLLYADQLSPVEHIFKFEPFDSPILRETVGRLLCGAYDAEIYNNEIQIRELTRAFDQANAEYRSLLTVLGRTDQAQTFEWIEGQRRTALERQSAVQQKIEAIEKAIYEASTEDQLSLKAQESSYETVQQIQTELVEATQSRDALRLEIVDSAEFLASLERKVEALSDSENVAKHLGDIRFRSCPACYSAIEHNVDDHTCHLCKSPLDTGPAHNRIIKLINETGRQLRQSKLLQGRRNIELSKLEDSILALRAQWRRASEQLAERQRLPSSELRAELRSLNREAGYIDRELEDLAKRSELARELNELASRKDQLNASITRLRTRNDQLRTNQEKRLGKAYSEIESEVLYLLHHDLPRQDAFVDAKHVEIDFGGNSIGVDGQSYFSASSRVILKSSFFLGFLLAAAKDKAFRHPRLCILDTIEDKGMEQIRSHNFQRQIVLASKKCSAEHQIIFATAMIAPDLDLPEYTIGKPSTLKNPTIDIGRDSGPRQLV